jgi:hypothetical protein
LSITTVLSPDLYESWLFAFRILIPRYGFNYRLQFSKMYMMNLMNKNDIIGERENFEICNSTEEDDEFDSDKKKRNELFNLHKLRR